MAVTLSRKRSSRKTRRVVNIHQNQFEGGYQSTRSNSRRPQNSLSDLTNMEIVQDYVPRPRPSTTAYGTQATLTIIGRGKYRYNGERWELFMMNDGGVGKLYKRKDGGAFTLIAGATYTTTVWSQMAQSMTKVFIWNGVDRLTYLDLTTGTLQAYTPLTTPAAPAAAKTGMAGTTYTYYYKVSANNAVGTSTASSAGTQTTSKLRNDWILNTDYMTVTWSAVAGATSYNVYVGTSAGNEQLVITVTGLSWVDDGTLVSDPFTLAPLGNSTQGMVARWIYVDARNSQIFAIDNDNKLWYSAAGTSDFSPYNGGGYIPIDENGDTELNYVDGFRDGKGNPVITVSARGSAGMGKMFHVVFDSLTYGDQVIVYGNVYEANGQSAPYAPRAVLRANDSLIYPTGKDFKSTGTSQNIVNILTTNSVAQAITEDLPTISLASLENAVGAVWEDKLLFALPVSSTTNNQIWYMDTARKNIWVLRWTFSGEIKDLWVTEDSSGIAHLCILIGNRILEFTRNLFTEDDGVAFNTRCAFSSLVFDEDGLVMANIRTQYYKYLDARGALSEKVYGLDKNGVSTTIGSSIFRQTASFTGWDSWTYDNYQFDALVGTLSNLAKSISADKVKVNAKMINQLDWEITTDTKGCDYLLSAVNTNGTTNDRRKLGD